MVTVHFPSRNSGNTCFVLKAKKEAMAYRGSAGRSAYANPGFYHRDADDDADYDGYDHTYTDGASVDGIHFGGTYRRRGAGAPAGSRVGAVEPVLAAMSVEGQHIVQKLSEEVRALTKKNNSLTAALQAERARNASIRK